MKAFKRVFKYVWPQWHRLVVIVVSATMIAILFAFSIGTVLPLLKVMMGEEGLHGWIDRIIAKDRYGVSFYVPDKIDVFDPNKRDILYHLRITAVKDDSQAAIAGLEQGDWIVGVPDGSSASGEADEVPSAKLLEKLATAESNAASYTDTAVAALVDSAPGTLDTLNELCLLYTSPSPRDRS